MGVHKEHKPPLTRRASNKRSSFKRQDNLDVEKEHICASLIVLLVPRLQAAHPLLIGGLVNVAALSQHSIK